MTSAIASGFLLCTKNANRMPYLGSAERLQMKKILSQVHELLHVRGIVCSQPSLDFRLVETDIPPLTYLTDRGGFPFICTVFRGVRDSVSALGDGDHAPASMVDKPTHFS